MSRCLFPKYKIVHTFDGYVICGRSCLFFYEKTCPSYESVTGYCDRYEYASLSAAKRALEYHIAKAERKAAERRAVENSERLRRKFKEKAVHTVC